MTPVETWIYQLRGLTLAERVLLPYYCARANGDGTCFPSYGRTADDCELSRRSVITGTEGLCSKGAMSIVADPVQRAAILAKANGQHNCRVNVYQINVGAVLLNGEAASPSHSEARSPSPRSNGEARSPSKPAHGEAAAPSSYPHGAARSPSHGAARSPSMVKLLHADGEAASPEYLTEKRELEPKSAPASAVTSGAGAPQPGKVLDSGGEGRDGTPPPAPPKAPTLGAQPEGAAPANAFRQPGEAAKPPPDSEPDPFADGGESSAYLAGLLGKRPRTLHLAANDAGRITEDDPPQTSGDRERMAAQMARQLEQLGQELKMRAYPPGRFPALTRDEQHDVLMPQRPVPRYLPAEVLNAMPHRQRARAAAAP